MQQHRKQCRILIVTNATKYHTPITKRIGLMPADYQRN